MTDRKPFDAPGGPEVGATKAADATYSQSLERGLAILEAFGTGRALLGVSELARELTLGRSTTHRYVATLARLGYLQQDPATRKYRLGLRVLDLGYSALTSTGLQELSAPYLQQLSDETGHTVNMAILDDLDIVYVARCRTTRPGQLEIDLNLHVGSRLPAYCTSMGKVLLAYLPEQERSRRLERVELRQRGPNTLVDRDALAAELARVRSAGLAVNDEELAAGLRSIAVPVGTGTDDATAAINLAVHRTMVSMEELVGRLGPALKRTARDISARLGHGRTG